jgi:CTD small phosphatase-like protein 2
MKNSKSARNSAPQGNVIAKSKKLTIDVPPDDDVDIPVEKFSKNSPVASKVANEIQKVSGSIFAPKHKSPSSSQSTKRCYTGTGAGSSSKVSQKVFKFPASPKPIKKILAKPPSQLRNSTKPRQSSTKYSQTPTNRNTLNDGKKRPKTATVEKKSDTGSTLNHLVTSIKKLQPSTDSNKSDTLYKEHLFQTFQAMKFVRSLQPVNLEHLKEKRLNVPVKKGFEGKKTIIFDLDETLVHCCEDLATARPDVILPVTFPTGEIVQAGINIRPFALECLREVNKDFEVFVFTASHPCYANVVLDYLDPCKELIQQRFFRDSCINVNGVYIKDLRIFANRNLKDMVIVDNAAYSFAYQLDNGVPIVSWHDDPNDKELFNLMDYVKALAAVDDVRDVNDQTFHLRSFYEDYINEFLANDTAPTPRQIKNK